MDKDIIICIWYLYIYFYDLKVCGVLNLSISVNLCLLLFVIW